jgi:hypothetical protein
MQLVIHPDGTTRCIYGEAIDLAKLGSLSIQRGSYVEPDEHGRWLVDLAPCGGLVLGPFAQRSQALAAEECWLIEHWLTEPADYSARMDLKSPAIIA